MFLDELTPIVKELTKQPVAFFGGFFSGVLKLNLSEDPLKSWLERQGVSTYSPDGTNTYSNNGGPQPISID